MSRKPKGWLFYDQFIKSFDLVPRVAICLLVERHYDDSNHHNEVLLSKRNMPPELGKFHYPGTFLLKNETISDAIDRLLHDELHLSRQHLTKPTLARVFENLKGDPRGHVIDIIYRCRFRKRFSSPSKENPHKAGNLRFFSKLPQNIGFGHRRILNELKFR